MRSITKLDILLLGLLTVVFYLAHSFTDRAAIETVTRPTATTLEELATPVVEAQQSMLATRARQAPMPIDAAEPNTKNIPPGDSQDTLIHSTIGLIRAAEDLPAQLAIELLRPMFSHPRAVIRRAAYETLADMKHPQRLALLSSALSDPEVDIRVLALDALSEEPPAEALAHIEYGLGDPNVQVRIAAIDALAEFDSVWVMPGLGAMLSDPEPSVRQFTTAVLGEIGSDEAIAYLRQARFDNDRKTREIAKSILHELDRKASRQ